MPDPAPIPGPPLVEPNGPREGMLDRGALSAAVTASTVATTDRAEGRCEPAGPGAVEAPGIPGQGTGARVPERLGRYRIIRLIGEGGMGSVYEAEQEMPRRTVALKVIRAEYLSPSMLRRFEFESQVLGRLQHPGIAQVHEAGMVQGADGPGLATPYFAMELVRGATLTGHARERGLGTRQRLELVARVCDGVYHAHQKGVVHRDLKPGNILVDESGQPKILDFGVARSIDSDMQQTTLQTNIGTIIGTIQYMSPEQAAGDPAQVDTRSDVYALGVIAYELLTGRRPHDLKDRPLHEALRLIREDEPSRLSSLDRTLRGDVETIVAKALEKDKARRYQSAEAMASDIRRYLRHEPISARRASTWYQAARFARRNRVLVAGMAATFLALVAGLAGTGYGLVKARQQTRLALAAKDAESRALGAEKERSGQLNAVAGFQSNMLASVNPRGAGLELMRDIRDRHGAALLRDGSPETDRAARERSLESELARVSATDAAAAMIDRTILKPAVAAIDGEFADQPIVGASLRQTLSNVYENLGLYQAAMELQEGALEARQRLLGPEHADTLASVTSLGRLLTTQGRFAEAEGRLREAAEQCKRLFGEDDALTIGAVNNLALAIQAQGRLAEAEPYFRDSLEKHRRIFGEDSRLTLIALNNMGGLLESLGRHAEAEPLVRESLEKARRVLGEDDPDTARAVMHLGTLIQGMGRLADSEPYIREAAEKFLQVFGRDHPESITALSAVGITLVRLDRIDEAESCFRDALDRSRRVFGNQHSSTSAALGCLGYVLQAQGRLTEAEPVFREALEVERRALGQEHPDTLISIGNLGHLLAAMGRLDEAGDLFSSQLEISRRVLVGEANPGLISAINNVVYTRLAQGRLDEAESLLVPAVELADTKLPPAHEMRVILLKRMQNLYEARDKAEPGKGYDAKAAHWRAKFEAAQARPASDGESGQDAKPPG